MQLKDDNTMRRSSLMRYLSWLLSVYQSDVSYLSADNPGQAIFPVKYPGTPKACCSPIRIMEALTTSLRVSNDVTGEIYDKQAETTTSNGLLDYQFEFCSMFSKK